MGHVRRDADASLHVARHGFPDAIFLQRHGEWWQVVLAAYRARVPSGPS